MPARKNKKEAMARQGYKEAALRRQAKLNLPLNRGRGIYNWIKNEGREKEPENPKWRLRKPERKEASRKLGRCHPGLPAKKKDTARAQGSCTAQASKAELASKYPNKSKMDKKEKHALLCEIK